MVPVTAVHRFEHYQHQVFEATLLESRPASGLTWVITKVNGRAERAKPRFTVSTVRRQCKWKSARLIQMDLLRTRQERRASQSIGNMDHEDSQFNRHDHFFIF